MRTVPAGLKFDGSNTKLIFVKNEKGPGTRWDSLLAMTRQNDVTKAPVVGSAPLQCCRMFLLKKRRIDGFGSLLLLKKYEKRRCRRS